MCIAELTFSFLLETMQVLQKSTSCISNEHCHSNATILNKADAKHIVLGN